METKKNIDWEQRRYEIAKDIAVTYITRKGPIVDTFIIANAISIADSLIKELKKEHL